jgi:ABC-type multidrug transport system fused ATPase/permease subunit
LIYGALLIGSNVFLLGRAFAVVRIATNASRAIHQQLFTNIFRKVVGWYERTPAGRIINRFTKDMYVVDQTIGPISETSLSTWLMVLGTFIVIAIVVPPALVITGLLTIGYYFTQSYYRKSSRELQRLDSITRTPIFTHFGEALSGCVSIRAFDVADDYYIIELQYIDENQRCWTLGQIASFWLRLRLDIMSTILVLAVAVLAVASRDIGLVVNPSNIGLMMVHSFNLATVMTWAITMATQLETSFNSVERVQFYSTPSDHEQWEPTNPSVGEQMKKLPQWPSAGKIEFKNYTMKYRPDLPVILDKVNVTFPAGSRVGIVGRTGKFPLITLSYFPVIYLSFSSSRCLILE